MKKLGSIILAIVLVLLGGNIAFGDSPSGPTTSLKSVFAVTDAPEQFQLVQQVLDFPPGAWTSAHSHGGLVFVTIAQGEVTQFSDGKETTYKTGQTWTETPGHVHQAGNVSSAPARTLVTFLLPPGSQQTTQAELANAHPSTVKTVAHVSKFDVPAVARPFDVVELQLDFQPGQVLPSQAYGGPAFISVLDGELTTSANGTEKSVKAGETWTQTAGQFSQVTNTGTAPASAFVTVLLPKGAALTTSQAAPAAAPQAGGNGEAFPLGWVIISAIVVLGGGILLATKPLRTR